MDVLLEAQEISALAYTEVDRETDLAAATVQAAQAPVSGTITEVLLFNPESGSFGTAVPTITVGQQFGVAVYGKNTSARDLNMYVVATATAPDGSSSAQTLAVVRVEPAFSGLWTAYWTANAVGEHKVTIVLYAEAA